MAVGHPPGQSATDLRPPVDHDVVGQVSRSNLLPDQTRRLLADVRDWNCRAIDQRPDGRNLDRRASDQRRRYDRSVAAPEVFPASQDVLSRYWFRPFFQFLEQVFEQGNQRVFEQALNGLLCEAECLPRPTHVRAYPRCRSASLTSVEELIGVPPLAFLQSTRLTRRKSSTCHCPWRSHPSYSTGVGRVANRVLSGMEHEEGVNSKPRANLLCQLFCIQGVGRLQNRLVYGPGLWELQPASAEPRGSPP